MTRNNFAAWLLSTTWLVCFSQAMAQQSKPNLNVGVILPLSGPMQPYSQQMLNGMELALTQLQQYDEDLADRISLIKRDDKAITQQSIKIAEELLKSRRADVLIGSITGDASLGLAKVAKSFDHPLIVPSSSSIHFDKLTDNVFRSCVTDELQGKALAKFAIEELKRRRVAIFYEEDSLYSNSIAESFSSAFTNLGGTIAIKLSYKSGSIDFRSQLEQIKRLGVGAILAPGFYPEVARMIRQAKRLNIRSPFLGGDGWQSPKFATLTGAGAARGHYFSSPFSTADPDEGVKQFIQAYQAKFQTSPSLFAMMGYESMIVVGRAFSDAQSNLPSALTRALRTLSNVDGVTGSMSMGADQNLMKPISILVTTASGAQYRAKIGSGSLD